MFIETQKINSKKLTIAMSRTSLKVVGPKYIRQVLDARFSFFGSNSQWRLPSDSVEHATRYTAKHKLIAVCRATSVIYRQPTQPTEQAESVAHNKETKRTHTHTHSDSHTNTYTTQLCSVRMCVWVCVRGIVVSLNFPFCEHTKRNTGWRPAIPCIGHTVSRLVKFLFIPFLIIKQNLKK